MKGNAKLRLLTRRGMLLVWMAALFPVVTSAKQLSFALFCVACLTASVFAIWFTRASLNLLLILFGAIVLTLFIPFDLTFARGDAFRTRFIHKEFGPAKVAEYPVPALTGRGPFSREPDLTIGVKPRWLLEITVP